VRDYEGVQAVKEVVRVRFIGCHDVQMAWSEYEAHCKRAWDLMAHWLVQSKEFEAFGLSMQCDEWECSETLGLQGWVTSSKLDMVPIRINQSDMGMWPAADEARADRFPPMHFAATALLDRIMGEIGRRLASYQIEASKGERQEVDA
jgi:hypothetical protein